MLIQAKRRAKIKNLDFNLDINDVIVPYYCPLLKIKINMSATVKDLTGPSLDRIIPKLGYIKGNVRVISKKANMMKLNCSLEELETFAENIIKYIKNE